MKLRSANLLCACAFSCNLLGMENKTLADALAKGDLTTFKTLFQTKQASVDDTWENVPLLFYAVRAFKWSMNKIPDKKPYTYQDGNENIHATRTHNIMDMITFLLNNNAPVNLAHDNGTTPLHLASSLEGIHYTLEPQVINLITLLLKHGARINAPNKADNTPLHSAALYGNNSAVIAMLIRHGANLDITNHEELTAYEIAVNELDKATHRYEQELTTSTKASPTFHRVWLNYIDDLVQMQQVFEYHRTQQRAQQNRWEQFRQKKSDVLFSFR